MRRYLLAAVVAVPIIGCEVLAIGNNAYKSPLVNAKRDATAIAGALETLGCQTTVAHDLKAGGIRSAVAALAARRAKDLTVIYFAGHGFQDSDGEQFILGTDGDPTYPSALGVVSLSEIENAFVGEPPLTVVVDACRTSPLRPMSGPPRSKLDRNRLRLFSASKGQSASDRPNNKLGAFASRFAAAIQASSTFLEACRRTAAWVGIDTGFSQAPVLEYSEFPDIDFRSLANHAQYPLRTNKLLIQGTIEAEKGEQALTSPAQECERKGKRLPTLQEAERLATAQRGIWIESIVGGKCEVVGGSWHPALGRIERRKFACDVRLPTVALICVNQ